MESFQSLISNDTEDLDLSPEETSRRQNGKLVQHNYHDHSCDKNDFPGRHPAKGGVTVPFPLKLYDMLDQIHSDPELASIVNWQPHGRCFLVIKQKEFTEKVMPRFFQQKKYASFQRQLNLYGFSRITRGPDRGSYYHECLLRGKRFLTFKIQRMKIKGTGGRMASNPSAEPNFYMMSSLPDPHSLNPIHPSEPLSSAIPDENSCQSNIFVFGDMPFYPTEDKRKGSSRRHSLEDPRLFRRKSLLLEPSQPEPGQKRNSMIIDETFMSQLEEISSMSKYSENDEYLVSALLERIL